MRILISTTCLLSIVAFSLTSFAQESVRGTKAPVYKSSASYSGPIFDVHLHTDPPASAASVPNPVTGVAAAEICRYSAMRCFRHVRSTTSPMRS
jgi:hypothetical protein